MRAGITVLVLAAVCVLVALAVADALRSRGSSSTIATATAPTPPTVSAQEIVIVPGPREQQEVVRVIANRWAQNVAGPDTSSCFHMTQRLCERIDCIRIGGYKIRNCTPIAPAFFRSFKGATVQDVVIRKGYRAAATFSNGEVVELFGDGGTWWIRRFGEDVNRKFFE